MSVKLLLPNKGGVTKLTVEPFNIFVFVLKDMLLEMKRMSKFSATVRYGADEPTRVTMGHQMIVEAMLPGEGSLTLATREGLYSCVAPVVNQKKAVCCEGFFWITQATGEVISGGPPGLQILDGLLS